VGAYNGQGLNRYDSNRDLHKVVRFAYPFQLDSGQFFELGLSGYDGKFVPGNSPLKNAPQFTDRRAAANFVWYPQPFGLEAEWTVGEGPESVINYDSLGRGIGAIRTSTVTNRHATTNAVTYTSTSRFQTPSKITTENLHGGYVMLNYKADTDIGTIIPFTRWGYFNGARKFRANAPSQNVNEIDFGIEYQPWPSFEIALVYTRAFMRTNTDLNPVATGSASTNAVKATAELAALNSLLSNAAYRTAQAQGFYNQVKDVDRVTLQMQYNF
jgi:hypothetical protein